MSEREIENYFRINSAMSGTKDSKQNKSIRVKFKLLGTPPNRAYKWMEVAPNQIVMEIKNRLIKEFRINPILDINLIFKQKILPDLTKFGEINYNPSTDNIVVILSLVGGGA